MNIKQVNLNNIKTGERFRKKFDNISELAASIVSNGLINPIAVKDNGDFTYTLIAGERRLKAFFVLRDEEELTDFSSIPARIYEASEVADELSLRIIELAENIDREDMTPQEEVNLTNEIHKLHVDKHGKKSKDPTVVGGWSQKDTAEFMGKDKSTVARDIMLAEAMEAMPELAKAKTKKEAHALLKKEAEKFDRVSKAQVIRERESLKPDDEKKKKLIDSYHIGDALEFLKTLSDKSADLFEIDPPYAIDLKKLKRIEVSYNTTLSDYNEIGAEGYLSFMYSIFKEAYQKLKINGWLICWFAPDPWFESIYHMLTGKGFPYLRDGDGNFPANLPDWMYYPPIGFTGSRLTGGWKKSYGQTMNPETRFGNVCEHYFYVRKGKAKLNKPGFPSMIECNSVPPKYKIHPTQRPISLMTQIISAFVPEGSKIIVPFGGSGATGLAAADYFCDVELCDLEQSFKDGFTVNVDKVKYGDYSTLEQFSQKDYDE